MDHDEKLELWPEVAPCIAHLVAAGCMIKDVTFTSTISIAEKCISKSILLSLDGELSPVDFASDLTIEP